MKIYTWLQKVILAVMTCIFLIIAGGNLFQFSQISLSDGSNTPFLLYVHSYLLLSGHCLE